MTAPVVDIAEVRLGRQLRRSLGDHRCGACHERWADHTDEQVETCEELRKRLVAIADRVERALDLSGSVAGWNDAPGRTADEVIAVLERVAAGEGA